jgi:3-hydroxybutyryl-CoA dehydrogenase
MIVEEGVATPEDVDRMWEIFTRPAVPPLRPELPDAPRRLLQRYVDEGRLREKSGSGFYEVSANE